MGIKSHYFIFTDEDKEKVESVITHYLDRDSNYSKFEYTRGHYQKRPCKT